MVDSDQVYYARNMAELNSFAKTFLEAASEPMLLLNSNLQIETANSRFAKTFKLDGEGVEGKRFFEIKNGYFDRPELHKLIEGTLGNSDHQEEIRLARDLATDESPKGTIAVRAYSLEGKDGGVIVTLQVEELKI